VISLIKRIEKDKRFEPNESRFCNWCAFPEYCPAKKHDMKVESLPVNEYLKETGVSLVNQYAAIAAKIKESKEKQDALEEELEQIKEAAVEYARKEGITSITGSDHLLKVSEEQVLQFPRAKEERRDELESYLRKVGLWPDVTTLNLSKLEKMVQEETVESETLERLRKFAEESTKHSVRLVKKRESKE